MRYYLSKIEQKNGDREVHTSTCVFLPKEMHRVDLGEYFDCNTAIEKARQTAKEANGCYFCARLCHEK